MTTDYEALRKEAEALLLLREEKPAQAPYSPLEQRMASLIERLLPALEDAQKAYIAGLRDAAGICLTDCGYTAGRHDCMSAILSRAAELEKGQ